MADGFLSRLVERFRSPNEGASPEDETLAADQGGMFSRSPEMALLLAHLGAFLKPLAANEDSILRREGAQDLSLYDALLDDDVAMSNLQQRRLAITSKDWEVAPGDEDDPRSVQAADDLRANLKAIAWDEVTGLMHYGVWHGYAIGECLWTTKVVDGRRIIWIDEIVVPDRRWFGFSIDGALRYTASLAAGISGVEVPPNKFWTFRTGASHHFAFYGLGLAHWAYWPIWFKRSALKFWALYLEKLSQPTAVGEFKEGATQKEKNSLVQALLSIGRDSAVIVPEGSLDKMKLMEGQRAGSGVSSYKDFVTEQNEALMRVILGQPGTSKATAQGVGGTQSEVHEGVKAEIVKADADAICESFNNGPAKWQARWNHGPDVAPPRVYRILDDAEDLNVVAERDAKLNAIGIKRTDDSIAEVYGSGYERKEEPAPALLPPGQTPPRAPAANDDDEAEEDVRRQRRTQFAAGDEMPLYVSRPLRNVAAIKRWAAEQGIANVDDDLHVTVLYSRTPVDPFALGSSWNEVLTIPEGGPRAVQQLGEKVVLRFSSDDIEWRHRSMIERGASHDYPEFLAHVSIADAEGVDIEAVEPYTGELVFGPEIFREIEPKPPEPASYAFEAAELEAIDRLRDALVDEANPVFSTMFAALRDNLAGVSTLEGARVALLEAMEQFDPVELAKRTGLPMLAARLAADAGVETLVEP